MIPQSQQHYVAQRKKIKYLQSSSQVKILTTNFFVNHWLILSVKTVSIARLSKKILSFKPTPLTINVNFLNTENNVQFHTFQLESEKPFRVVIRNLHPSSACDDIKSALENSNLSITSCKRSATTHKKKTTPPFLRRFGLRRKL